MPSATRAREAAYDSHLRLVVRVKPYAPDEMATEKETASISLGYLLEWHAKDGNLDRDVSAYRAFYDAAVIDGGVILRGSPVGYPAAYHASGSSCGCRALGSHRALHGRALTTRSRSRWTYPWMQS